MLKITKADIKRITGRKKKTSLSKKESEIQREILGFLEKVGIYAWRQNNLAVRGRKFIGKRGVSDILGCLDDGRMLAIEVKKPGEVPDEDQEEFLRNVRKRGGLSFWADSVDVAARFLLPQIRNWGGRAGKK